MSDDPSYVDDYLRDQSRKVSTGGASYIEHYHAAPGERPAPERPRVWSNIPKPAEVLVGRDTLKADIHADLDAGRAVSLHGMGGIGKTALAAAVACERQACGEVVCWREAGQRDWAAVYDDLARDFGDLEMQKRGMGTKPAHARSLLAAHGVRLVVLDDVWDETAALTFEHDALPPSGTLLLTGRTRVGVGNLHDVEALGETDSVTLFRHHAGKYADADVDAIKAVCRLLGGHPMALEIAGRMAQRDRLYPKALHAHLTQAKDRVRALSIGDAKHVNVWASLYASYEALEPNEKAVFKTMGALWRPTATAELLNGILSFPERLVLDHISF